VSLGRDGRGKENTIRFEHPLKQHSRSLAGCRPVNSMLGQARDRIFTCKHKGIVNEGFEEKELRCKTWGVFLCEFCL
jgi:hypothetical protein